MDCLHVPRTILPASSNNGGVKAAAWEHGTRKTPAPWALELDRRCRRYNSLPEAGGVLDQDDLIMNLMIGAENTFSLSKKRMKDFTPSELKEYIAIKESRNG